MIPHFLLIYRLNILKKAEKGASDHVTGESELKEADPIEKAEKDFWKIIDDEKRRRDRKAGVVSFFLNANNPLMIIAFHRLTKRLRQQQQRKVEQRLKLKSLQLPHHKELNNILFYFERNFHILSVCLALIFKYRNCFSQSGLKQIGFLLHRFPR